MSVAGSAGGLGRRFAELGFAELGFAELSRTGRIESARRPAAIANPGVAA
jgi:hypothetical protein